MVTCGICHEERLHEIGELDSCDHGYDCIRAHLYSVKIRVFCQARPLTPGLLQLLFRMHPAVGSDRIQMPIL